MKFLNTVALWLLCVLPTTALGAAKPNVLFIAVDDLNDWANCMGGRSGVHTPNLDALAARGTLFLNAHCAAPSCNPSRAAVMTGIRPSTSGVYANNQNWRNSPILKSAVTIPQHFRANGYRAIGGGKVFHALSWTVKTGPDGVERDGYTDPASWDDYFPTMNRSMPDELRPAGWPASQEDNGRPLAYFDWGRTDPEEKMADYSVVNWAAAQMKKPQDKPLFLAVGLFRPHIPWFAPGKYFDMYPLDKIELPKILPNDLDDAPAIGQAMARRTWHKWVVDHGQWPRAVQGYLACISFMDAQLGRLIAAFDASPMAANTVIVLWSDHGMHIGEKENWEKFTLWEEATRVPLIVIPPKSAGSKANQKCAQPVSLLDIYPTLSELCGLQARPELEGKSLAPQLRDPAAVRAEPALITWGKDNHAIRDDRWRYIHYRDGGEELYDHQADSDELTNLAGKPEFAPILRKLSQWLPKVNAADSPKDTGGGEGKSRKKSKSETRNPNDQDWSPP